MITVYPPFAQVRRPHVPRIPFPTSADDPSLGDPPPLSGDPRLCFGVPSPSAGSLPKSPAWRQEERGDESRIRATAFLKLDTPPAGDGSAEKSMEHAGREWAEFVKVAACSWDREDGRAKGSSASREGAGGRGTGGGSTEEEWSGWRLAKQGKGRPGAGHLRLMRLAGDRQRRPRRGRSRHPGREAVRGSIAGIDTCKAEPRSPGQHQPRTAGTPTPSPPIPPSLSDFDFAASLFPSTRLSPLGRPSRYPWRFCLTSPTYAGRLRNPDKGVCRQDPAKRIDSSCRAQLHGGGAGDSAILRGHGHLPRLWGALLQPRAQAAVQGRVAGTRRGLHSRCPPRRRLWPSVRGDRAGRPRLVRGAVPLELQHHRDVHAGGAMPGLRVQHVWLRQRGRGEPGGPRGGRQGCFQGGDQGGPRGEQSFSPCRLLSRAVLEGEALFHAPSRRSPVGPRRSRLISWRAGKRRDHPARAFGRGDGSGQQLQPPSPSSWLSRSSWCSSS